MQANCPVCGAHEASLVYSVPRAPVTCTAVFDTPDKARAVPLGSIDLAVCGQCGFAYNAAFDVTLARIGAELDHAYESSQTASGHFNRFAMRLAVDWVERYRLRGKTVIEVGSGGGDFATCLLRAGVATVIAIDPLTPPHPADERVQVVNEPFGPQHLEMSADALVCRHTLEHVPDVRGFLRMVHSWTANEPRRKVLFELPSAERIMEEGAFWDIYYEHSNYFTRGTLRRAFQLAGFRLLRLDLAYHGQYFLAEAVRDCGEAALWTTASQELQAWAGFGLRARKAVERCRKMLDRFAGDVGPLVLWQGAAKTVGLLSAVGSADIVYCAVDLSPARQGRYLPGSGLAVRAPHALRSLQPRHIILMNPVYFNEVRVQLDEMNVKGKLYTMQQLIEENMHDDQETNLCEPTSQ